MTFADLDDFLNFHALKLDQENARFGQVCATQANSHRDGEKKPEPFVSSDFFVPQYVPDDLDEQEELSLNNTGVILDSYFRNLKTRTKMAKAYKHRLK